MVGRGRAVHRARMRENVRRILCVGGASKRRGWGQINFEDRVMRCLHQPALASRVCLGDGAA